MNIFAGIRSPFENFVKETERRRERRLHIFNYLHPYETTLLIIAEKEAISRMSA